MILAGYIAFWGLLYRFNQFSAGVLEKLRLPGASELLGHNQPRIARLQFYLGVIVSVVALLSTFYLSGLDEEVTTYRYLASLAPLLVIIGLDSLRNTSLDRYRQHFTLNLPLLSLPILLWAGINQDLTSIASWYHRSARMFIAFAILGSLSYFTYRKMNIPRWKAAVEQWLANVAVIACVSISLSLVLETAIYYFSPGTLHDVIEGFELVGISIGLVCAVLTLAYILSLIHI